MHQTSENTFQVDMLSIEEFAAKMSVGRTTVHEWLKSGRLRPGRHFIKIGGTIRFIWGAELLQRLLEDSIEEVPKQEAHTTDIRVNPLPQLPASRKRETQINLGY
jgi:excisionase family DNA binding protein